MKIFAGMQSAQSTSAECRKELCTVPHHSLPGRKTETCVSSRGLVVFTYTAEMF